MAFAGNLFRFFVYSNLFIAFCAVLMVYQTDDLLLHQTPNGHFAFFVFFATICSYSFHWYLTPDIDTGYSRARWLKRNRRYHIVLFLVGLAGVLFTSIYLLRYWPWLLLSAFITFLYTAPKIPHPWFRLLRKVAMGKTVFLAFVWMYITTILPLLISDTPWRSEFTLFAASRFFLIYAICIVFDYRDREYDKSVGIRSLITWLSEKNIAWLFIFSLLLFLVTTVELVLFQFRVDTVAILLLPGLITAVLYRHATRSFSDILYYFVLDGLMALSAFLMLLPIHRH